MSENNLQTPVAFESDGDVVSSSNPFASAVSSSVNSGTEVNNLLRDAASFTVPSVPGAPNSVRYAYNSNTHPDWGSGYNSDMGANANNDVFSFNFGSLNRDANLMTALGAAARVGVDLFANANDPDSSRIVINDPGNGSSLLIGDGLHLFVGATLADLLSMNNADGIAPGVTNSVLQNIPKGSNFKNGPGHMIVWNKTGVVVSASNNNATMEVGAGNKLYVGDINSGGKDNWGIGNLQLGFNEQSAPGKATMMLDEGSYLSVNGYLGGTADKSNAGAQLEQGMENRRTGAVSAQNHVKMDVEGDWGMIGDPRTGMPVLKNVIGNDNQVNVRGNMGVYMKTSLTTGSNTNFELGSAGWAHTGSGLFVGSGGYMSTGYHNTFNIFGGMGAGFVILSNGGEVANLLLGDNNSVVLTDKVAAIFGAEAGALVSAGNNFLLTGAEISVGYGENGRNRVLSAVSNNTSANMSIGDNANISLGFESLIDNSGSPAVAKDGVIVLDATNSHLTVGKNAHIQAKLLSVGNYLRNSSDSRFNNSSGTDPLAQYFAGQNNSVVIGTGANISLAQGIVVDETNGYVELDGGTLSAGSIRIGRYYQGNLQVPVDPKWGNYKSNGNRYMFSDTSAGKIVIGDGYSINLTNAGGQDGALTINGNGDVLVLGNNVNFSANGMYMGDYKVSDPSGLSATYLTSKAVISTGQSTSMTFSGEMDLNGVGNSFTMLDNSYLHADKIVLDQGASGNGSNNTLTFGNSTTVDVANGVVDNVPGGKFTLGQGGQLILHSGDFQMHAPTSNMLSIGSGGSLTLQSGNLSLDNKNQSVILGDGVTVSADMLVMNGSAQVFSVGNAANVAFKNGIEQDALSGVIHIGSNANFQVGSTTISGNSTDFTLLDGAYGSLGTLALLGTGIKFNTGSAQNLSFGDMRFGSGNTVNLGGSISGGTTIIGSGTTVSTALNTSVDLGNHILRLGGNATLIFAAGGKLTAGNIYDDLSNNTLNLQSNITYNTQNWAITNTSGLARTLSVGAGATGSFGNLRLGGKNITFNATSANDLAFQDISLQDHDSVTLTGSYSAHDVTIMNGSIMTLGGHYVGNSMSVTEGGTVTVSNNAVVNLGVIATFAPNVALNLGQAVDLTAGTIQADLAGGNFRLGTPTAKAQVYHVQNWILNNNMGDLSAPGQTLTLGTHASGDFGNLTLSGRNITFDTSLAINLNFGNLKFGYSNTAYLGGVYTAGDLEADEGTQVDLGGVCTVGTLLADHATINFGGEYVGNGLTARSAVIDVVNGCSADFGEGVVSIDAGTSFSVEQESMLTAGNTINIALGASNAITLSNLVNYNTKAWSFTNQSGVNRSITLGDNSWGSFGDLNLSANTMFNTGNTGETGDGLAFGTVNLAKSTSFNGNGNFSIETLVTNLANPVNGNAQNTAVTMNGQFTIGTVDMSRGGTVSIGDNVTQTKVDTWNLGQGGVVKVGTGTTLNINNLQMDGTSPGVIEVGAGSTLHIGTVSTSNVSADNMPKIVLHDNAHILINGQDLTQGLLSGNYDVDFNNSQNGIYEYDGNISDISGQVKLDDFNLTDQFLFSNTTGSTDATKFSTSYSDGILSVLYQENKGDTPRVLATFAYNPVNSSDLLPNINIVNGADGQSKIDMTKCFVMGVHILTVKGELPVEDLSIGDEVVTIEKGQHVNRKIIWVGSLDVDVNRYKNKDALYPVRIKAHAFGLNRPYRDLLVTPEHTIYVDGGLIPARMLVNGRSISIDRTKDQFRVYHVETEQHSILLSENLMTESYLNTDNRHLFDENVVQASLEFDEHAGHKSWEEHAAAPLMVAREKVEPVWNRLNRRATQLGYKPIAKQEITRNPDLCLLTQKGERIAPVSIKGNVYSFYVSSTTTVVAMHSRSALPSEVVGPFLDDRRKLGVLVAKISVVADKTLTLLPSDFRDLSGWHAVESQRTDRWTEGLAQLPSELMEFSNQDKLIRIELTDTASYFMDKDIDEVMKLA